jgi:hypothetical protein
MGSPHRPVWLADPALVAEDRSIDGRTNGQIGQELGLRETVKDYVSSILSELESPGGPRPPPTWPDTPPIPAAADDCPSRKKGI